MNQGTRIEILKNLQAAIPDPKSELEFSTPFELLVAVVLSAQATDKSVNVATRKLFPVANTPKAILKLGEEKFQEYVRHIGLYRGKTANIMKLCRILVDKYDSKVPKKFEDLVELPGVGQKTASVVLNVAFGEPRIAVDTHVFRVANRTGYAPAAKPEEAQKLLEHYTPLEYRHDAHHWFILLGRYTCKSRKPECHKCPIVEQCEFPDKVFEKKKK